MSPTLLHRLWAHMEWADAHLWRTLLSERVAQEDDYVVESLFHIHVVQRAYLAVWQGDDFDVPTREDFGGLLEIRDWARAYHAEAAELVRRLSEERLDEIIPIPWTSFIEKEIGGPPGPASLGDMLFQVAAHSVHHRAQINRRLRELGEEPSMVDYIGWIWRGRPQADWSDP